MKDSSTLATAAESSGITETEGSGLGGGVGIAGRAGSSESADITDTEGEIPADALRPFAVLALQDPDVEASAPSTGSATALRSSAPASSPSGGRTESDSIVLAASQVIRSYIGNSLTAGDAPAADRPINTHRA
jgi:hypothetical protein